MYSVLNKMRKKTQVSGSLTAFFTLRKIYQDRCPKSRRTFLLTERLQFDAWESNEKFDFILQRNLWISYV